MSSLTKLAFVGALAAAVLAAPVLNADHHEEAEHGEKGELTLSHIMKEGHKGKTSIVAKVKNGEATEAELQQLIGFYIAMEKLTPPRGEAKSWRAKTRKLTGTSLKVYRGVEGATEAFSEAVNCKACHSKHKED